jgi:hypothetical protein
MKTADQVAARVANTYHESLRRMAYSAAREGIDAYLRELYPHVLSFEPDAIRDHFEVDDDDPTEGMSDEELEGIGTTALQDDRLYEAFHEALSDALGVTA